MSTFKIDAGYTLVDSNDLGALAPATKREWRSWRSTVALSAIVGTVVLIANITLIAWAAKRVDGETGMAVLYDGNCPKMKSISAWSHLGINVLSTALLAASNATMQYLSAPTRNEIDKAHSKGKWLDIGVSGIRNWKGMSRWRKCVWLLLALSSLPLHLLYNSVIFNTTSSNNYLALVVSKDFAPGTTWNLTALVQNEPITTLIVEEGGLPYDSEIKNLQNNMSSLQRLENAECIRTFEDNFVSDFLNVLVVTNVQNANYSVLWASQHTSTKTLQNSDGAPFQSDLGWICGNPRGKCEASELADLLSNPTSWSYTWHPDGHTPSIAQVDFCLAQPWNPTCTVVLTQPLLVIVIVCNIIKLICFLAVLLSNTSQPIITIGDAIASFLNGPDPTTAKTISLSAPTNLYSQDQSNGGNAKTRNFDGSPFTWKSKKTQWFRAASRRRWVITIGSCLGFWILGIVLLLIGQNSVSSHDSFSDLWATGFGIVSPNALVQFTYNLTTAENVLVANSPQLLLSIVYLSFNGLLTSMLLSKEYTSFASHRKSLRVSSPVGYQRSTFWLSLPYRYSIPLLVASGMLHWLLSQSIFLAEVNVFDFSGAISPMDSFKACGWSGLSLTFCLVLGGVMIIAIVSFGFRHYDDGIPIAGSCSAAISAACHPLANEKDAAERPLMYGVLADVGEGIGKAGFGSGEVRRLISGHVYV